MKKIFYIALSVFIASCTHSSLSPKAYVEFVRNPAHNLHQVTRAGSVEFEVQYQPLQYVCLTQNGTSEISSSQLKELESQFEGLSYFIFSIISNDQADPILSVKSDTSLLKQRIEYLSFKANKDFWLLQGSDTLHCMMHHFERNFGIAPKETIVLAFEPLNSNYPDNDITFCFRDGILGTGYHQFTFKVHDIQSIPSLKTI